MNKEEIRMLAREIESVIERHNIKPLQFTLTISVPKELFVQMQKTFDGASAGRVDFIMAEGDENWGITFTSPAFGVMLRKED